MIFVLVLMLAAVAAAELVRTTCRRALTAPHAVRSAPADLAADADAVTAALGERVAA